MRTPLLSALLPGLLLCLLLLPASPVALAGEDLATRAWDVGALVAEGTEPSPVWLGLRPWLAFSGGGTVGEAGGGDDDEGVSPFVEPDELADLVRAALPEGWDEGDDAGLEVTGTRIVLRAPAAAQAAAEAALAALWREASRRIEVEVDWIRFGETGRTRLAGAGLLEALEGGRLDEQRTAQVLEEARREGNALASASTLVRPGRRALVGRVERTSYVEDYEVEIAQNSAIGNPVVQVLPVGWHADVRPFALADGGVFAEVLFQAATLARPIERIDLEVEPLGSIEIPTCDALRVATAVRTAPGESAVLLASPRPPAGDLGVVIVTSRVVDAEAAPSPGLLHLDGSALGTTARVFALVRSSLGVPLVLAPVLVPVDPEDDPVDLSEVLDPVIARFPDVQAPGGLRYLGSTRALLGKHDPAVAKSLLDALALREEALRTPRLRLRVFLRPPEGAAREIAAAALDVPAGRLVAWQAGTERTWLVDWDVEVAQEARVGDPIVSLLFGGLAANLRLDPAPGTDHAALRLDLEWSEMGPIERRPTKAACVGSVEAAEVSSVAVHQDLLLAAGRPVTIEAGRREDGSRVEIEVLLGR